MFKYKGLQSLPGGFRSYVSFITRALEKVEADRPSRSELLIWIKEEFKLTGQMAPRWYIHTLLVFGLVVESEGGLFLSETGREFLETRKNEVILKALVENFAGVEEILTFLQRRGEAGIEQIRGELESACDFGWKTSAQTSRRLLWLRALGYVEMTDNKYFLTSEGRKEAMKAISNK